MMQCKLIYLFQNLTARIIVTDKIPKREITKNISAIFSKIASLLIWFVFMDKKESSVEAVKNKATIDVISSIKVFSTLFEI